MTRLETIFEKRRSELIRALNEVNQPRGLISVVDRELDQVIGMRSAFATSLTVHDYAVLTAVFDPVRIALGLLCQIGAVTLPAPDHAPEAVLGEGMGVVAAIPAAVGAAATVAAAVTGPIGAFVVGTAVGMGASLAMRSAPKLRRRADGATKTAPSVSESTFDPIVAEIRDRLPDVLFAAARSYDRILEQLVSVRAEVLKESQNVSHPLEKVPNILPFLHDLVAVGEVSDDDLSRYSRLARRILMADGIRCVTYEADLNDQMFDRETQSGAQPQRTVKPALLRDDLLIARGIVGLSA